jgi:hypothetical protein
MMKHIYMNGIKLTATVVALGLAACSGSGTSPKGVTTANVSSNTLQMNVGTANIHGVTGTNVSVTYRQPSGQSGTLVNSPSLTFPHALAGTAGTADAFNATIVTGPASAEIGTAVATSTGQNGTNATTFGIDGGAFGLGLEPFNYGNLGVPDNIGPYQVPVYDAAGYAPQVAAAGQPVDPNAFIPLGGLPAFDPSGNAAAVLAGFNGVSEGLNVFATAPAVGTYTLAVAVPGAPGSSVNASISTIAPLPTIAAAPVPTITAVAGPAASTSATIAYVQPAGVTEAYVQVTDFGPTTSGGTSCLGASLATPVYYTVVMRATGTATLPAGALCSATDNSPPGGTAADGDAFTVQVIGFDYPAYEASYPNSLSNAAPSLAGLGASHQADVTISPQAVYNIVGGAAVLTPGGLPSSRARHAATATIRK